ncbi:hippurate hydrolase [Pseudomonas flavescens]|uniref:Hippurate hydrolase n=1 Tax=Phytopseudomonas flavescens TaxID=29435 RepID=A0A1G8N049_9GAMM|nr:M20 aminoacylase family protein [Pseudomonas flavescens]SDI72970.1 hippurate hydrolase [Pseudomonas flavescens]
MSIPDSLLADARHWRRQLHAQPELGFAEHRTSARVAELLEGFGLEVHRGLGGTGVVGVLRHGEGPSIGLRADMDALPIQELGEIEHRSTAQGCMHACGHDGHTAILLATARHLSERRGFAGTVYFVFQPAEENLGGAQKMIDDGLFERFPMQAIYGLHNWPGLPAGTVAVNPGAMMASLDTFAITLTGKGCHAAMPERGNDPIVAAADLVLQLQTIVSRRLSPLASAVVSVTLMQAGEAINVIPEVARLQGTVRCLDSAVRAQVEALIAEMVAHAPAAHGVTGVLDYTRGYPVTQNHPQQAARVLQAATLAFGEARTLAGIAPSMASEDFAFMLEARPGAYLWLGVDGEQPSAPLHNPFYDFNDAVIEPGVRLWTELVGQELAPR